MITKTPNIDENNEKKCDLYKMFLTESLGFNIIKVIIGIGSKKWRYSGYEVSILWKREY